MAVGLAVLGTGCGLFRKAPKPLEPVPGASQIGVASWYGPGFHGRRTANGEVYDQYGLTAAHRTLPHGTWVEVTNLSNDRSVRVRINDRGPYVDDRVIDLSYTAAQRLDMVRSGIAPVRVEVVEGDLLPQAIPVAAAPPPAPPPPARPAPLAMVPVAAAPPVVDRGGSYRVHVGVYVDYERARREQRRLDGVAGPVRLVLVDAPDARFYQLRAGPFASRGAAERAARQLADLGAPALVVVSGR
ncbi:septal ring lytic transglycosylase RlpA family protein [bacterium]|nr:septal ring lytic transglycosylase RlpA family protein [bacterium]